MAKGALIMNYIGHGGVLGWAHARVLEIPAIKSWTNFDNMQYFLRLHANSHTTMTRLLIQQEKMYS